MSVRKKTSERCPDCLMRLELCLCSLIPRINLATRLIVIGTKRELITPTNTGRLATQALPNSVLLTTGDLDKPFDIREHLMPHCENVVLYPSDDAAVLNEDYRASLTGPVNLIVPDGNWRQTSKMRRRIPHLIDMPVVKVPLGELTQYRVRKESKAEGLATIEAIARALGALEGAAVQNALEELMRVMVSRTMASRGLIQEN
jgi:DTW domain-containing protein YfiP